MTPLSWADGIRGGTLQRRQQRACSECDGVRDGRLTIRREESKVTSGNSPGLGRAKVSGQHTALKRKMEDQGEDSRKGRDLGGASIASREGNKF